MFISVNGIPPIIYNSTILLSSWDAAVVLLYPLVVIEIDVAFGLVPVKINSLSIFTTALFGQLLLSSTLTVPVCAELIAPFNAESGLSDVTPVIITLLEVEYIAWSLNFTFTFGFPLFVSIGFSSNVGIPASLPPPNRAGVIRSSSTVNSSLTSATAPVLEISKLAL